MPSKSSSSSLPPADAASEPAHLQTRTPSHVHLSADTQRVRQQAHASLHIACPTKLHAPMSHTVGAVTGAPYSASEVHFLSDFIFISLHWRSRSTPTVRLQPHPIVAPCSSLHAYAIAYCCRRAPRKLAVSRTGSLAVYSHAHALPQARTCKVRTGARTCLLVPPALAHLPAQHRHHRMHTRSVKQLI